MLKTNLNVVEEEMKGVETELKTVYSRISTMVGSGYPETMIDNLSDRAEKLEDRLNQLKSIATK